MKKYYYLSAIVIAIIAVFIGGCKESATKAPAPQSKAVETKPVQPTPSPAPVIPEPNAAPAVKTDPNEVAVTVNDKPITEGQLEEKMAPRLKAMGSQVPPQYQEQMKQQLRGRALEAMIIEQLLDQKVKEKGITISDDEVNQEIEKQMKQQQMTEEDFKKALAMYGLTLDELKAQAKRGLGYQKLMEQQFAEKIKVSDEDAQKYYEQNKAEFQTPAQVRASHILVSTRSTDPNADPNKVKAEAKAKAEEVLTKVKAGGDFAALAKEYSSCPSAQKGGDLGFFGKGQMVKPFEDAAFSLEPNQVSGIVETEFGYHIIKVTDKKDANSTSFETAKPKIEETLQNQKKGQLAKDYINEVKAEAKIVYPPGKEPAMPKAVAPTKPADANTSGKPVDENKPADANAK